MNPSYPGSSGDRGHGPPQPPSMGSGAGGLNKGGQSSHGPPHSFHSQPPLTQLAHPGHHSTGLHPLHGGSGHGTHGNSILHGGPPPLPPPPLTSTLGQGNTSRSPHHPLSGSLLHPPRSGLSGTGGPSVLNKPSGVPGGLGPNVSGGQGSSAASVLMSHRLTSQSMGQPGGNSGPSLPAPGGLKTVQSFDVRPPSPRRDGGGQGGQSNQSQGGKQQYGNDSGGDYYSTSSMSMGPPPPRHRELRVEDALLYLDQVKQQFGDQPDIYNQFLDVMKDFKAQTIDTPGVIMRVSSLFRGYPNLILGFNTFLPPGYRIRPDTSIEVIPQQMSRPMNAPPSMYSNVQAGPQGAQAMGQGVHRPPPVTIPPPYSPPSLSGSHHSKQPTPSRQNLAPGGHPGSQKMGSQQSKQGSKKPQQPLQPAGNAGAAQNQGGNGGRGSANPVEFDHAIHYVTTIKQRFADEPETYKEFLAILHTYQKEQRSIRQVLDQVSYLFRDHPDLLREFTFFLPDGVQAIATERLNIAAAKAEAMKEMAKSGKYPRDGYGYPQSSSRRDDGRMRGGDSPSAAAMKRTHGDELGDDLRGKSKDRRDRDMNKMLFNHKRSKRRSYDTKERRQFLALSDVLIDKEEWGIFEKIKKILPSRDSWREFLKCLELYSQEVLGRQEMLSLVKNLFGRHKDLVDEFDNLLCTHGEQKDPNEIWPFIPLAETDLSQCRRATPSYRGLPASYPVPPCSFRSKLEKAVCNDAWVSVPTGSEDFSFKNMRKNQYEEALFKCEDERFEIDMVIDANASTISVLEPLAREIEVLKEKDGSDDKLWNYVVDKGTFRVTHLNAISRIYGEAGAQILELLRKYPAGAIPVILKRLKQKDEEWRKARQDLNKQWKEVNEKNYHKSLDHSSFYFKQKDKKQTSMKVLVQEAKKKLEADEKKASDTKADAAAIKDNKAPPEAAAIADALKKEQADTATENGEKAPSSTEWKDHFKYRLAAVQIHKDAFGLLSYAAEKNLGVADKEKVSKVWQSFFSPFFHLEEEWLVRKPKHTTVSLEKAKMLRPGTEVTTDFGEGTVQYFNHERGVCVVNLPMGQGYLQPNAITIQETSDFPPSLAILDDEEDANKLQDKQKSTLFAPQHAYVFLRLYQMLHSRLERAFELCEKAKRNRHRRTINPAARALDHARASSSDLTGAEKTGDYQAFLTKLYALIDGSVDNTKYEDCCRSLMGSTSYFLFTMDKLVTLVLKQMQYMATDDTCQELLKLFAEQNTTKSSSTDIPDVEAYLAKTKGVFEGEGAYRLEFKPGVLRRTPLEPRVVTPAASSADFKIWAPSPRVRQQEPSKWLIEPELSIQYLGSVDDEGDDDDDDESPIATPPETPSQTPVFGSPYHESLDDGEIKKEDSQDADQDVEMESGVEASSDEEDNSSKDAAANILKKRARHSSEDDSASQDKRLKTDDDDKEEGEDDGTDEAMDDASADEVTSEHTASSDDGAKSDANSEKSKGDKVAEGASSTENGSSTSSKDDKASS
ncbi:hypothetical protein Poli38472_003751 [Pythium oligandrum]|uniref:Histone deacetylase interacting domain-containing protein n=1 Tax=Pythium oligandrum TaxID=41045 RepID=A0A8K1FKF1_PYTOL|nr:hypothetical protein Poli38472_003751 [Pythium oligandrum]|eukprot:TMW65986.1 hypothetical protein Poli38472_003751 [Pythium oligandrum]